MRNFYKFLKTIFSASLIVPLALISFYLASFFLIRGVLPSSEEIIQHLTALYARYGYELIFLGAALEALVVVNFFVPGALAVGLGAVFARSGELDLSWAVMAAASGAILGFTIDYFLGLFGFGKIIKKLGYGEALNKLKGQIVKSGVRSFSIGFIHPNLGSLISVAAGALEMSFINFMVLSALSTFAWITFWGLLIFALGEIFLVILTKYIVLLLVLVLSIWILSLFYARAKEVKG